MKKLMFCLCVMFCVVGPIDVYANGQPICVRAKLGTQETAWLTGTLLETSIYQRKTDLGTIVIGSLIGISIDDDSAKSFIKRCDGRRFPSGSYLILDPTDTGGVEQYQGIIANSRWVDVNISGL